MVTRSYMGGVYWEREKPMGESQAKNDKQRDSGESLWPQCKNHALTDERVDNLKNSFKCGVSVN